MGLLIDGSTAGKRCCMRVCLLATASGSDTHGSQSGPADHHQPINDNAYGNVTETHNEH